MSSSTIGQNQQKESSGLADFVQGVGKVTGGTILSITMLTSAVVAGGLVGLAISFRNLPDVRVLRTYVPTETTYIYDIKGKQLDNIHGEANREVVPLDKISPNLKRAVMAIEDSHFYYHHGVNPNSIGRAVKANFSRGGVAEGASTITMQLVKNLFLSHKRAVTRKIAEAVLAIRVEQVFKKDEILEMYLNQVYWGHNNYGVQTAAASYFGKPASELNLAEAAMMAGMIQAPEDYSPFYSFKRAKDRQADVLRRMRELGWITPQEELQARNQKLKLGERTSWRASDLPYVTEGVVQELIQRFGREAVQKGGMRVQTTVDYKFQKMAEQTVKEAHQRIRSNGFRPDQIVLVSVDPRTHFIKAIVGGISYKKSQFNRATQARRQPGSSFKPFVYYAALATGKYTPDTIVNDSPVSYRDGSGYYTPRNYGGGFAGPMPLRTALAQSRNIPAVVLGRAVGLDKVIEICRTLGIRSPMEPVVSLPLGAIGVTPLEMANAYATFASTGWYADPTMIVRVTDSSGNLLLDNTPKPRLVLDPWAAASLNSAMQTVITNGTGKAADIGRQAGGKTGTTSSERDVWFVGYVPQLSTAIWIGNDNNRPMGGGITGGGFAAPIWKDFMTKVTKDMPVEYFPPASKFPRP